MLLNLETKSVNNIGFTQTVTGKVFEYTDSTHDSFLSDMGAKLGVNRQDGTIVIPSYIGEGSLKNYELEQGLFIRSLDFKLFNDFQFTRWAQTRKEKYFQLYYFLDRLNFHFSLNETPLQAAAFANSIFMTNDLQIHGQFQKNDTVKAVIILFTDSWIQKNKLHITEPFKTLFTDIINEEKSPMILNPMKVEEYNLAADIHKYINSPDGDRFAIKINSLLLIKNFLSGLANREHLDLNEPHSFYFPEMVKLEKRLSDYLTTALPSIKVLSKEFNLSESTLKRHFRIVYGKNIYQYYLEKKMELAKEMIEKERLPVAAVAYSLGYEKVSSLTSVFKKIYNVLPKSLKIRKTIPPEDLQRSVA